MFFLLASVVAALVTRTTGLAVEQRAARGGVVFKSLWVVYHLYDVAVACTIWGIVYELIGTLLPWCRTKVYDWHGAVLYDWAFAWADAFGVGWAVNFIGWAGYIIMYPYMIGVYYLHRVTGQIGLRCLHRVTGQLFAGRLLAIPAHVYYNYNFSEEPAELPTMIDGDEDNTAQLAVQQAALGNATSEDAMQSVDDIPLLPPWVYELMIGLVMLCTAWRLYAGMLRVRSEEQFAENCPEPFYRLVTHTLWLFAHSVICGLQGTMTAILGDRFGYALFSLCHVFSWGMLMCGVTHPRTAFIPTSMWLYVAVVLIVWTTELSDYWGSIALLLLSYGASSVPANMAARRFSEAESHAAQRSLHSPSLFPASQCRTCLKCSLRPSRTPHCAMQPWTSWAEASAVSSTQMHPTCSPTSTRGSSVWLSPAWSGFTRNSRSSFKAP